MTFFIVSHQTYAPRRSFTTLTKFNPKSISDGPKNPNFDPAVKMGRNQCHCKDYQLLIPTTIHESKSELERPRYHEKRDDTPIDAPLTFDSHNV